MLHDAFEILGGDAVGPVLLTAEHAYPGVLEPLAVSDTDAVWLQTHWGYDLGVYDVVRAWVEQAAVTAVCSRVSRLVCDHNRALGAPTWARTRIEGVPLSFNQAMNREEIGRRIETLWRPYHDTIDVEIERHLACGVRPYLLSVHSFTPELLGERRDFDIGVLFSVYDEDACAFARIAEAQGLRTRLNAPYSGRRSEIYSVAHHALTHALPFLELEVNQALLGSASGAGDVGRTLARVSALMLADRGP